MKHNLRWFENLDFWRDMEPKVYSDEQWQRASLEVDEALELLEVSAPAMILDMGCGTGRHSIELARRGYSVTGVDLNGAYIDAARENASRANLFVDFLQGDMRTFQRPGAFVGALLLWNAFGYFETDEEDIASLRAIRTSLGANGRLLVQTHGRESTARKFVRKDWFEIEGRLVLDQRWIESNWSSMRTRYVIIDEEGRREHVMSCRLYSPEQLTALLRAAGFERVAIHGGLNGVPYDEKAFELVAVASAVR